MTHFPMFYNLEGKEILLFGGGRFALERVEKLLPFGAKLTVISETVCEELKKIDGITVCERVFCERDLDVHPILVIIAEDEPTTCRIYAECKKRNIPVNAVDNPKYCDVIFPSVVSSKHLCIGISSGGISPTATVVYKEKIAKILPERIDAILEWMPSAKEMIREAVPESEVKRILREVFAAASERNRPLTEEELKCYCNE